MNYQKYNREERDLCAHLFRLLLDDQIEWGPLNEFLGTYNVNSPRIFCEVALIRDAYYVRKPNTEVFMDNMCEMIAHLNQIKTYTHFSDLPVDLQDCSKTHPKQIYFKLKKMRRSISENDRLVYGDLQAVFNAKPDLLICTDTDLVVYEAKYTSGFNEKQMMRTMHIAQIWSTLLYTDLGFKNVPSVKVRKLGMGKALPEPGISWEKVYEIAAKRWGEFDFSVKVLSKVLQN